MSKAWRGVAAFEATASEVRELEVQSQATKSSKKKGKLQAKKRKKQVPSLLRLVYAEMLAAGV
eukprot:COSAG01_NODE_5212_length_4407_cov_3.380919_6_plen_63_part_00